MTAAWKKVGNIKGPPGIDGTGGAQAVADHEAKPDPHAQYQKESEKGQASGYASLGSDGKVPTGQLPASAAPVTDHGALTGLADDDHTQYARADGSRGAFEASGAVADHELEADPHPQYALKTYVDSSTPDVYHGTAAPSGTGYKAGDIYCQYT